MQRGNHAGKRSTTGCALISSAWFPAAGGDVPSPPRGSKIGGIPDFALPAARHALVGKEVSMTEEKPKGVFARNAHRCAVCGQAVAVLSILFLVPYLRRRHEHSKERRHGWFPIRGH
jgi:hypothetical protein